MLCGLETSRQSGRGLGEIALAFLILGTVAFGGPAAHVALMRRELIVKRKWLPEDEFKRMFAACNLIPGPSSTELAIFLGYRRGGWPGLVTAGVLFILPAMLIMLAIAWLYTRYGTTDPAGGILYGVRAAVTAIVVWAIIDLGRRLLSRWLLIGVAAAIALLFALGLNPVILIVTAGLVVAFGSQVLRHRGVMGLFLAGMPDQAAVIPLAPKRPLKLLQRRSPNPAAVMPDEA